MSLVADLELVNAFKNHWAWSGKPELIDYPVRSQTGKLDQPLREKQ